ncbi:DoxX family protein [Pontibacter sp. SGAir0037]|uniref:DoxX family protein n=1 Tax=Pontibacter sp. SGAir0037 TaxID=2571030 RepID=UPI0010CD5DDB|nr:DoxX family protein [Pontibacter sp. SGAir0037]QCR21496.1 DoxX family protein [Pontibacter sp. SGAir0037]
MNLSRDMHTLEHWADTHHPLWIDFLRIGLGLFIFIKGVFFIQDTGAIQNLLGQNQFGWLSLGLAHYVAFAHLVGGILIAIGLVTRVAILFQLPILIGAVFFINSLRGFSAGNVELWISVLVLALLIFFFIFGSGRFSVDHLIRKPETDILY